MPGLYQPDEEEFDYKAEDFFSPYIVRQRRYKHFDLPIERDEEEYKIDFEKNEKPWRFLPLIGYTQKIEKHVIDKNKKHIIKQKERPIRYASHRDSAYLEAYAQYLGRKYEKIIKEIGIEECVLAYRRGAGSNIDHANNIFKYISLKKNCVAIAMDIKSFFDEIDHKLLKHRIIEILNSNKLHGHHASIWKNMTKYSWVEKKDIKDKNNNLKTVCTREYFKQRIRGRKKGLVKRNTKSCGIPQGTPLSGLYANIYMIKLDKEIKEICDRKNGLYRRYSDDIVIILDIDENIEDTISKINEVINKYKLKISNEKTEISVFQCGKLYYSLKEGKKKKTPFQYLGFEFDGERVMIRRSTINRYIKKMIYGIRMKIKNAKKKGIKESEIYKREVLSRYTHLGKRRNFLKYAYKAAKIMESEDIRIQVKSHMRWFKRAWKREVSRIYKNP